MSNVRSHEVKLQHAANAAIGLAITGWLSGAYGVLSSLGDPAPWVSNAELETHRQLSLSLVLVGLLALLISVWLSGYSFRVAPRRAALACLGCIVPALSLFAAAFHYGR
jgi:hypothetical protein